MTGHEVEIEHPVAAAFHTARKAHIWVPAKSRGSRYGRQAPTALCGVNAWPTSKGANAIWHDAPDIPAIHTCTDHYDEIRWCATCIGRAAELAGLMDRIAPIVVNALNEAGAQ